ncbi:MAG: glycine cleavage system aminomethyltransferase GcvT [Bacteroidota bacterium]
MDIQTDLKSIPLEALHAQLGAKMMPFAGFTMPVRYSSDLDEHNTVRNAVGIFDVSHMGEFMVRGKGALPLIQWVTSNDAAVLTPGKIQYSCLPNGKGGIVDDLLVYNLAENEYLLVVNAGNIDKDWAWINKQNEERGFGAELEDISARTGLFAVQGPKAAAALASLTSADLEGLQYYTFVHADFAGIENVLISATGYTGSGGFEIYVPAEKSEHVWNAIMEAGKEQGIKPIGLGARDTLRLEMGFCLYGNDIDDTTSPIEAGLGWITKFTKPFIDSDLLAALKKEGTGRKLVAFKMLERGIPRGHYELQNESGETIGMVTSGTQSPTLGIGVGLGYVQTAYAKTGTKIFVNVRTKPLQAETVKLPFYLKG